MKKILLLFLSLIPMLAFADSDHDKLIGHWLFASDSVTCNVIFEKDGAFSADVTEDGKPVFSYSGKWSADDGSIHYESLKSTPEGRIPPGSKDVDKLDSVTPDYFVVTIKSGEVHAYTRVTDDSEATAKLSDEQLRESIQGVWFTEDLVFRDKDGPLHVGERTMYFPDGRFVADYRISYAGGADYIRTTGEWSIQRGKFVETAKESSNPDRVPPPFMRRIAVITAKKMVIVSADQTHAALLVRGDGKPETGKISVSSLDEKKLLKDLQSVHMSGFNPVPVPKSDKNSWVLDSQMLPNPPTK